MMKLEDTELREALEKLDHQISADQYYDQVVEKIIDLNRSQHWTFWCSENVEYDEELIEKKFISFMFSHEKFREDLSVGEKSTRRPKQKLQRKPERKLQSRKKVEEVLRRIS